MPELRRYLGYPFALALTALVSVTLYLILRCG
jgi:Mg2+ and Co2+ transporter CorA